MIVITFLLFLFGVFLIFIQNFLWAGFAFFVSVSFLIAHFLQKSSYIRFREQNVNRYLSDIAASQLQRNEEIQKHLELIQDKKDLNQKNQQEFQSLVKNLQENKLQISEIISNPRVSKSSKIKADAYVDLSQKIHKLKESDTLYKEFINITKDFALDQMYQHTQNRISELSDKITNRIETYNSAVTIYNSDLNGWDRVFVSRNKEIADFYSLD